MSDEPTLADVRSTARDVFGYDRLRPGQGEAIGALLAGRDVLLVLPTGAGKSAAYQLPGLELPGPTLVVSPLIALQQDQVRALTELGHEDAAAAAVSSAVPAAERRAALEAAAAGELEFLFLSPEQLANDDVLDAVRAARPSLVAVDEAHCVSVWGHDFRPEYLRLGERIDTLEPRPRVLALTATASPPVREDVVARLHLRDAAVVVKGFARPGIALEVVRAVEADDKDRAVVERVREEAARGVGIVYVATRRRSTELAEAVGRTGLRAAAYHGGMRRAERDDAQRRFTDDELDVVVATSAFGMGIDKPDVRFVVHADVPGSPDSYYQEVGRAGRDGEPAVAVLFYRPEDLGLQRYFAVGVPDRDDLREVARTLPAAGTRGGSSAGRARSSGARGRTAGTRLPRRLARLRALVEDARALVGEQARPAAVADAARELAEDRRRVDDSRLQRVRAYAETTQCRRQFLLAYLGEDLPEPCGRCDTCWAGTAREAAVDGSDVPWATGSAVRHPEFGEGTVMGYEGADRVTVLFETHGYRTLSVEAAADQDLLTTT